MTTSNSIPFRPFTDDELSPCVEMFGVSVASLRAPETIMLEGIDWRVNRGEFWVVGGLLGSGKSDLMAMTAGIMPPALGSYRLFGKELRAGYEVEPLRERIRVGLVFDGGQLLHDLTILENIALPLQYHRDCRREECAETIEALLDFTELRPIADRRPGDVSHNWRQRAGLGRALALRPDLLLVDSPLSGMDPRHAHWWIEHLVRLSSGQALSGLPPLTLVVTTSDLRPWKDVAARFAILKNRRFISLDSAGPPPHLAETLQKQLLHFEPEIS